MYKRYWVLIGVLVVSFGAYGWWWGSQAEAVSSQLKKQIDMALPSDVTATYQVGPIGGFPFRFVTDLTDIKIAVDGSNTFTAGKALTVMQPGNDEHIIMQIEGPITYALADGGTGTIKAEDLLISIRKMPDGAFWTDVDALTPHMDPAFCTGQTANRATIHLRTHFGQEGAYDMSMTAAALREADSGEPPLRVLYDGKTLTINDSPVTGQAREDFLRRF